MIINRPCEPILAGTAAVRLKIIKFNHKQGTFHLVFMIQNNSKERIQECLSEYQCNFSGIGKLKGQNVKLHTHPNVKPVDA